MNYKIFLIISFLFVLTGCEQNNLSKNPLNKDKLSKYKNSGFALIYNQDLKKIKKLEPRSLNIYHKSLKRKSAIKITNPIKIPNGRYCATPLLNPVKLIFSIITTKRNKTASAPT